MVVAGRGDGSKWLALTFMGECDLCRSHCGEYQLPCALGVGRIVEGGVQLHMRVCFLCNALRSDGMPAASTAEIGGVHHILKCCY